VPTPGTYSGSLRHNLRLAVLPFQHRESFLAGGTRAAPRFSGFDRMVAT